MDNLFVFSIIHILFVDDADKWVYNFASLLMESTEDLLVESIEPKPLAAIAVTHKTCSEEG
jgi:anthranilate/para-aminobenzoate synthase component II